jgi:DnaJ-class molecular chaperone
MSGYYPDGMTQADHDRAFGGDEPRECDQCDGTGTVMTAAPGAGHNDDLAEYEPCPDCHGTSYEIQPGKDTDDAYEAQVEEEMGCV